MARALGNAMFTLGVVACTQRGPEKIYWNKDSCSHCKMVMTDSRFGGELLTEKGKVYKFDSLECMAAFQKEHQSEARGADHMYLSDSLVADRLVPVEEAWIVEDPNLHSPMGKGFLASGNRNELEIRHVKAGVGGIRRAAEVLSQLKK